MPRKATGKPVGRPRKTSDYALTARQTIALELALRNPDGKRGLISSIARTLGVSRQDISKLLKTPHFRKHFQSILSKKRQDRLAELWVEISNEESKRKAEAELLFELAKTYIPHFVYKNWTGPVEEAGGGVLFSTEQMLIDHLISNELVPIELFQDSSIFKVKRGTPHKPKGTAGEGFG
ncbi:MAG TPA: hypothetical protein VM144_09915 [Aestuariivirga sp.]|nr:hypothetical protein [Aestuariivirga sp.]